MSPIEYVKPQTVAETWNGPVLAEAVEQSDVIIGGAPRTGTTLLEGILTSCPSTNPLLAEAAPLRFLLESYAHTVRHTNANLGKFFDGADEPGAIYRQMLATFLDALRHKYDCGFLVLKEPKMTKNLIELADLVPDIKFVCMVRDPRAAIASMLQWGRRMPPRDHLYQTRDIDRLVKYFHGFYMPLLRATKSSLWESRIRFVRYEDLVTDPERIIEELRQFTGFELQHDCAAGTWKRTRVDFAHEREAGNPAVTDLYGGRIRKDRLASYKEELSQAERKQILSKSRVLMNYFRYR